MKIISMNEAKALGLKRYFTGNTCQNGHTCERRTYNRACVLCEVDRSRRARLKSPSELQEREQQRRLKKLETREKRLERKRLYRRENLDRVRERERQYRLSNLQACRDRGYVYRLMHLEERRRYNREYHRKRVQDGIIRKEIKEKYKANRKRAYLALELIKAMGLEHLLKEGSHV